MSYRDAIRQLGSGPLMIAGTAAACLRPKPGRKVSRHM